MTAHDLALLVKKCRDKQKEHARFKTEYGGGKGLWEERLELERQVDRAVKNVLADKGTGLFDEEER